MRALLAFDKFKDSLSAQQACEIAAKALPGDWSVDVCPLADGGDGFECVLSDRSRGQQRSLTVSGPRGLPVQAGFSLVAVEKIPAAVRRQFDFDDGSIAVVEMARASGLALVPTDRRDPWFASTIGTGQLLRAAAEAGANRILLGIGGSATHDLGLGALHQLGLVARKRSGSELGIPVPRVWPELHDFAGSLPDSLPPIAIACDVDNPLTGPRGAAACYGPQKGLQEEDIATLDELSARVARKLCAHFGRPDSLAETPGAGAAGGIAFGLMAAADACLISGSDLVAAWLEIDRRIEAADVVITGEGRFDNGSLGGKGPGAIVRRAIACGKSAYVFAGTTTADAPAGASVHAITPAGIPLDRALQECGRNLFAAVNRVLG